MNKQPILIWTAAAILTLASAVWQRLSGPTHPIRGSVMLNGTQIQYRLTRTHGGEGDQPIVVRVEERSVGGSIAWRRYPTNDPWQYLPMQRDGDQLKAALPHQPPAGKLEYHVRFEKGGEAVVVPVKGAVTRFKGAVPNWALIPHVIAMFLGMLWSTAAGIQALAKAPGYARNGRITLSLIAAGGLILGPVVQKYAFGEFWTGVPFGYDLTDNKTLIAALAWAAAVWFARKDGAGRGPVLVAALVTLVIFVIPHSVWGSEIKWETHGQAASGQPVRTPAPVSP